MSSYLFDVILAEMPSLRERLAGDLIERHSEHSLIRGPGAWPPKKIFKSEISRITFPAFWDLWFNDTFLVDFLISVLGSCLVLRSWNNNLYEVYILQNILAQAGDFTCSVGELQIGSERPKLETWHVFIWNFVIWILLTRALHRCRQRWMIWPRSQTCRLYARLVPAVVVG